MHGHHISHIEDPGPLKVAPALQLGLLALAVVGLLAFAYGAFMGPEAERLNAWSGFLISSTFFWFLSMGGAAFLAINYIVGAKWFVVLKRLPEALASYAYRGGFVFPLLVALLGTTVLYPWAKEGATYPAAGTLKALWLSPGVHMVKQIIYIGLLTGLTFVLVKKSRTRARSGDDPVVAGRLRFSIIYMIIFAFVFSLFVWDSLMSLEPEWFSTMFGVYCFIGGFNAAMALMMMLAFHLRSKSDMIQERHLYDMGTYVMAFATFMIYIGFSQFMLIWYANIPEETFYFMHRYQGGWHVLTILLPILKWVIPFFVLMPPTWRTNLSAQTFSCAAILLGELLDIYWMVAPVFSDVAVRPSLINVLTFAGVFGFFGWNVLAYLSRNSMLPVEDPDLVSCVNGDYLHA